MSRNQSGLGRDLQKEQVDALSQEQLGQLFQLQQETLQPSHSKETNGEK